MSISIVDVDETRIDDIFGICSFNRLDDPIQKKGMDLKRQWIKNMLKTHGPVTKIAYHGEKPIGQILYYPETSNPTITEPRESVITIHCIYNPFSDYQRKGVGNMLLDSVIRECKEEVPNVYRRPVEFVVAQVFTTGEGLSLVDFYSKRGFKEGEGEMFLEIAGKYNPRTLAEYQPLQDDRGRAVMFYDSMCEWGIGFAIRVEEFLKSLDPNLPVELINCWEQPEEYIGRGEEQLIVNATPITAFWTDKEAFTKQVKDALNLP